MQRYEDPTMQGADFEVGTFVYFDNVAWVQKVKVSNNNVFFCVIKKD